MKRGAPSFELGRIDDALTFVEENDDSVFANLGSTPANCESLVLNDSAFKQAVLDCLEQESLDPLRDYS